MVPIEPIIDLLCVRYPKAFFRFEQRRVPLKIGIHHDLIAALKDVDPKQLRIAIRVYTANACYQARLCAGAPRVDLEGKPAGVVTPEQVPQLKPKKVSGGTPPTAQQVAGAELCRKQGRDSLKPRDTPCIGGTSATRAPSKPPSAVTGVRRMSLADLRAAAPT